MKTHLLARTILTCLLLSFLGMNLSARSPEIHTANGIVSGYKSGNINIFKGIPYATPPLGELRWKAPLPAKNWNGVLRCDKFSASPMQNKPVPFMMWTEEFITPPDRLSEDCLYLNIWAPDTSGKEKLPVLVWIYGGAFTSGSAACGVYDGEEMAKKGIIFVSFNYRVGVLGFLVHPGLSKESEKNISGNYGLLDQVAALQWIKKNITAFGGDPDKITIAGQSAGSMSVCALVSSPLAKGLFRGAIAQSGGILSTFLNRSYEQAENEGLAFMEKMKAADIAELRKIPAGQLIATGGNFRPVADGYMIPKDVFAAYRLGQFNQVNMMAGWVMEDGSLMGLQKISPEKYRQQAQDKYGKKVADFLQLFPGNTEAEIAASLKEMNLMQFAALPAYLWAGYNKGKSFLYQFTHAPADKPGFPNYGAFHTAEVPFALHTLHCWQRPWRESDYAIEEATSNYWANFVKTGNPNGNGLPDWPIYNQPTSSILDIGDQIKISSGLYKNKFEFLENSVAATK